MRFKKRWAMFSLVIMLSGCFDTPNEVILASEAVKIPGLPQNYMSYTVTAVPGSNDYRYSKPADGSNAAISGYARAIKLKDNIYAVQMRDDNQQGYTIEFFMLVNNYGATELKVAFPDTYPEPKDYGIEWDMDDFGMETVSGPRASIMAYIRAFASSNFSVSQQTG